MAILAYPALASANDYGVATELSADNGAELQRIEISVTCIGTGSGFVFDDMWQGIQDDAGWIELGTSFCDQGDPNAKWIWARYTPSWGYLEGVIQRNVATGWNNVFKIWNYSGGNWKAYINGSERQGFFGYGAGSDANSATVGLEVTASRINSTQAATYETSLKAWSTPTTWAYWAGRDACDDTSTHIYPKWITDQSWRHSLNSTLPVSSC